MKTSVRSAAMVGAIGASRPAALLMCPSPSPRPPFSPRKASSRCFRRPARKSPARNRACAAAARVRASRSKATSSAAPCALDAPEFSSIRFTLRGVEFEGLQASRPERELAPVLFRHGRERASRISAVCEIRDRAATILRDAGYIAAVEVPEQRIDDGDRPLPGADGADDRGPGARRCRPAPSRCIAGYLRPADQAAGVQPQRCRTLPAARQRPARLQCPPDAASGRHRARRSASATSRSSAPRLMPMSTSRTAEQGARPLGRAGPRPALRPDRPWRPDDRSALFATADFEEQQTFQLGPRFPPRRRGPGASAMVTYAWANPSIAGDSSMSSAHLACNGRGQLSVHAQPVAQSARGSRGMDFVNQDVELDGTGFTRDRLRVALPGSPLDMLSERSSLPAARTPSRKWRLSGQAELARVSTFLARPTMRDARTRLPGDGNVPPSRIEGRASATVLAALCYGEYRPVPQADLLAWRARPVWPAQPLLSFEEFAAGNYTVGRGYDPAHLLGDRGFGIAGRDSRRQPDPDEAEAVSHSRLMAFSTTPGSANRRFRSSKTVSRRSLSSAGGGPGWPGDRLPARCRAGRAADLHRSFE